MIRRKGQRIGLLGGSFNPAHEGHRWISRMALARLRLDEVWWLVSPQNPFKSRNDMAPFVERVAVARKIARHPRILVSDLEWKWGVVRTHVTLARLARGRPGIRFVWLMGSDQLEEVHLWQHWMRVFQRVPVAVFARPPYPRRALGSLASLRLAKVRVKDHEGPRLPSRKPPAWMFIGGRMHAASATNLRRASGGEGVDISSKG